MARERGATQELEGVLALLDEVQQASASARTEEQPPPRRPQRAATPLPKLFDTVRVDGEDQLGRAAAEDKIAILRKKVRALEDRMQDIREAWAKRDNELDEARQTAEAERQHREDAEASAKKLNAFLQTKKQEVEAYHARVQEALKEQMRREQEALQEAAKREQQARDDADRREQAAKREAARRVNETVEEHARREREALQAHSQREQEVLREQAVRERVLKARLEKAELAERAAIEREKGTPPPPPLLTVGDVEELDQAVTTAGKSIADLLKGRLSDAEWQNAMREALKLMKSSHELLASVLRDMR